MALQHLRSNTASKRPTAGAMSDGQIAVNTNATSPGLFFKDAGGTITKVGPVHVGTTAPNSSPAGSTGNSVGEQWLDTSGGGYVLKIWDGSAWRSEVGEFVDAAGDTMTGALILPSGTAAAPALGVGSTDNGVYSPGIDQVAISTNGTERLQIDSSGRLLVGTSSSTIGQSSTLSVNSTNPANLLSIARQVNDVAGPRLFLTKTRGRETAIVNNGDTLGEIRFTGSDGVDVASMAALISAQVDGTPGSNDMPGRLVFSTTADGASSPMEALRIRSDQTACFFGNTGTAGIAIRSVIQSTTNRGIVSGEYVFQGGHSGSAGSVGTVTFQVGTGGNVQNTNNSYGAISDIKLKENIVDAGLQWNDLKNLQVRSYNFKSDTGYGTHTQIGLIAQEVELVSPGLVSESPDRDEEGTDLGTVTKSVNYSVLYMKAVKALQEAMERIETLEQRLTDAGIA